MQQGNDPSQFEPTGQKFGSRYRYRSLFWPIVLIGAGVVWLLYNFDVVSTANLGMLGILWPILIIGIGFDLLIGHRSPAWGAVAGAVTVGLLILLMLLGPAFGWAKDTDLKTQRFTTPVGQASAAEIDLDLGRYGAEVRALSSATGPDRPLLVADVTYRGSVEFETDEAATKAASLAAKGDSWWQWLDGVKEKPWQIGLDPSVPLSLKVQASSGASVLDLTGLRLTAVEVDSSSGDMQVLLPAVSGQSYTVGLRASSGEMIAQAADGADLRMNVEMSSGDTEVTLGKDSDVNLEFRGSSGEFTVHLAPGQAFRVEVRSVSSGDVELPQGLIEVAQGDDEEGIWESQGYGSALHQVEVVIEHMSSGSVKIEAGS